MSAADLGHAIVIGVAGLQIIANGTLLLRGLTRLPGEITKEGATPRIADLLRTMWVYGVLANLCLSGVLLRVSSGAVRGEPVARDVGLAIGLYYCLLGIVAYRFSPSRHRGLLAFLVLGVLLLAALTIR